MKIAIGITSTGTVKTRTLFSICQMIKRYNDFELITWEGCNLHQNRENIVTEALKSACSHVLFVDSDMIFEPEAVEILYKKDKDIIGTNYNCRKLPLIPTCKIYDEDGNKIFNEQEDKTFEIAAVPTGFLLIKLDVFRNLPHPWFKTEHDDKGNMTFGSDMYFCREARKNGYKIYLDPTIKIGHIGDYIY